MKRIIYGLQFLILLSLFSCNKIETRINLHTGVLEVISNNYSISSVIIGCNSERIEYAKICSENCNIFNILNPDSIKFKRTLSNQKNIRGNDCIICVVVLNKKGETREYIFKINKKDWDNKSEDIIGIRELM